MSDGAAKTKRLSSDVYSTDAPWVVESKFDPCRPGVDLVKRDRLVEQLRDGAQRKLVLIIAPAGYGKSSLLGQWAAQQNADTLNTAWLTLENDEAEGKNFLAYTVLALARAGVNLDELVTGARSGFADSAVNVVLAKLVRRLNDSKNRTVLVLEDYHLAECSGINAILQQLLRGVVSDFTLFVDSRKQPNINAVSLIASGDAIEIDATQLRLTKDETFSALDGIADANVAADIYSKTEGWPVAVQLARLPARTQPGVPIGVDAKSGLIAAYLTEQVLSSLDQSTQEFLLTIAFLDRFNPELTGFVMQAPDAWGRIEVLSSFAALIVPLDAQNGWYRLHHLFAEYLKELQARRDPMRAMEIYQRASLWYADRGDIVRAVKYAACAKDYDRCKAIIHDAGGWRIILTNSIGELRGALRHLPTEVIKNDAAMLISKAYLHCKDGEIEEARAQLNSAIKRMAKAPDDQTVIDRVVVESMINLYEDVGVWSAEYHDARKNVTARDLLNALELGTVHCENFLIALSFGKFETAADKLDKAFSYMRQSGAALGLNYCYIHAAHLAFHRADFDLARANIERALAMAEENFGSDSGLKNLALVLHYTLKTWQGEARREDLSEFQSALFQTIDNDGWSEIYITGLEAAILLAAQCREGEAGRALIQKVSVFAKNRKLLRLEKYAAVAGKALDTWPGLKRQLSAPSTQDEARNAGFGEREWQTFIEEACAQAEPDLLMQADSLASRLGAALKILKIQAATARAHTALDAGNSAALLSAVKAASQQNVLGPFLADEALISGLRDLRWSLRRNERELITLKFIEAVLQKASVLHPQNINGLLSEREHEIMRELASGQSNKEIARTLELTENTVKFHLKSIYAKLAVSKRTQAVIEAQKQGLVD